MVEVTQLKNISGDVINPATLEELQVLKKGTWDNLQSVAVTITASGTWVTILSQAGPCWVVSASIFQYGGAEARANGQPMLFIDSNQIAPHYWATFAALVTQWGLDNAIGRVRITLDDAVNHNYVLFYDLSARPIWVPSGSTIYLKSRNTHAANDYSARAFMEVVA